MNININTTKNSKLFTPKILIVALMAWSGLMALHSSCMAQSANNTIGRIVVPFAPGGAREMPARAVYQEMAQALV